MTFVICKDRFCLTRLQDPKVTQFEQNNPLATEWLLRPKGPTALLMSVV